MPKSKPCVWEGKEYKSYKQAYEASGLDIGYSYFCQLINEGHTTFPNQNNKAIPCVYKGQSYPSIQAAAAAHNVSKQTMHYRIITRNLHPKHQIQDNDYETYRSQLEACTRYSQLKRCAKKLVVATGVTYDTWMQAIEDADTKEKMTIICEDLLLRLQYADSE